MRSTSNGAGHQRRPARAATRCEHWHGVDRNSFGHGSPRVRYSEPWDASKKGKRETTREKTLRPWPICCDTAPNKLDPDRRRARLARRSRGAGRDLFPKVKSPATRWIAFRRPGWANRCGCAAGSDIETRPDLWDLAEPGFQTLVYPVPHGGEPHPEARHDRAGLSRS